ncbi:threonine/homoserine/homoserine lactone efflux protein [Hoeflea marina]|uniref:Threonine/homoserine/homoserine lactone efflux protein n=1 Tax=Hoeflea marina TaxID=274592 RepID=A0A317PD28_9HYPH|nr:LysE family translocator [Hoeflea marina]PWV97160.1 threonine/homoserine/homoserine lactone efflux protein [Hoeflea marina]
MIESLHLPLILAAAFLASASPGPSTMAIAGTSMNVGRRAGLVLALGIASGSLAWSTMAALGMSAVMMANAWTFEVLRYAGAGYLIYLAIRAGRSALSSRAAETRNPGAASFASTFGRGIAMHLTNPKAILFFSALYSVGMPANATPAQLALVIGCVGLQSLSIFVCYAMLFSNPRMVRIYGRLRRGFEATFALAFGYAGFRLLTARLTG